MFLRQFQYLIALEQEGHFGRAAVRCNVSQPTLSSAIKHFEEELGVPIILRHRRFQGFTEEGRRVLEWSKRILADRQAMIEELGIMRDQLHGHLRIAAMPMSMPITGLIDRLFSKRHPAAQVNVQFVGLEEMRLGLMNFEFDAAITYLEQLSLDQLNSLSLYEEPFHLLVPDNDWFRGRTSVSWSEAATLPLCLLSPQTHERQITDKAFASVGCTPRPRLESNAMIALAVHAIQGESATVVPRYFIESIGGMAKARLLLLEEPTISQHVGLVWLKGTPMLPMTKAVVELMEDALEHGLVSRELGGAGRGVRESA